MSPHPSPPLKAEEAEGNQGDTPTNVEMYDGFGVKILVSSFPFTMLSSPIRLLSSRTNEGGKSFPGASLAAPQPDCTL